MTIYDYKVKKRDGSDFSLEEYKGKVLLIVNTATGCGFTPQYEGLEKLYKKYKDKGFEILDFPCNQFGNQAPGTDSEINSFCTLKYDTTFDRFSKIDVNGEDASSLFEYIKNQIPYSGVKGIKNKLAMKAIEKISKSSKNENDIKWNFTKFLIDRNGNVVERFEPTIKPKEIENKIKEIL